MNIHNLKNSTNLALLLGMFSGDGCLSIKHNGDKNRIYPIEFFNTKKEYVELFGNLFEKLFKIKGNITNRKRDNKKDLWQFQKYSKELYQMFNEDFEIYAGKKALNVKIPSFILNGTKDIQKHYFLGLLITDGSIRKKKDIMFHMASENIIKDLKILIKNVWNFDRPIKRYVQKNKHVSYQITLNKAQSFIVLIDMPSSHNPVLR